MFQKIGHCPAPVHLELAYKNGQRRIIKRTAAVWQAGDQKLTISIPEKDGLQKIEIKNRLVPDADVSNNIYLME